MKELCIRYNLVFKHWNEHEEIVFCKNENVLDDHRDGKHV